MLLSESFKVFIKGKILFENFASLLDVKSSALISYLYFKLERFFTFVLT